MNEDRRITLINPRYAASAVRPDQYPTEDLPEIAFVGRSNVGKSSLINSLCNYNGLARTSGTPGKTRVINFYRVTAKIPPEERRDFYLVDLPGYGFAQVKTTERVGWAAWIEEFLFQSPRLKLIIQLIDSRHPPLESDVSIYRWIREKAKAPLQVVATKADKLNSTRLQAQLKEIKSGLSLHGAVLPYSSLKNTGRDQLVSVLVRYLGE